MEAVMTLGFQARGSRGEEDEPLYDGRQMPHTGSRRAFSRFSIDGGLSRSMALFAAEPKHLIGTPSGNGLNLIGRLAMQVKDVMSRQIVSIGPDAPVLDAVQLMLQHRISGLPVIDASGKLQGVVTEGDFLRRAEAGTQRKHPRWIEFLMGPGRLASEYVHASGGKVGEVMTPDVHTVTEDAPLEDAVHLMERHRIKRLPVMRDGKVVGIVTRSNLMRALAHFALSAQPATAGDAAIRASLLAELEKQPWAPVGLINVVVTDGVVKLSGALTDERERQAIRVAAENIPGVRKVEDHLIWIEPHTGVIVEGPGE
jgi:CBS-domain-containing membrane protein